MSRKDNPLEPLEASQEEVWFRKKNQALIEEMRAKLQRQQDVAALRAETGVEDTALLTHLTELGITRETVRVLPLVPLLEVAWADGKVHPEERAKLLEAADEAGVREDPARQVFERLLTQRPSPDFFDTALRFIRAMLAALPEGEADTARSDLESLARRIAEVNAGLFFGIFGWVASEQSEALDHIARELHRARPEATDRVLKRV